MLAVAPRVIPGGTFDHTATTPALSMSDAIAPPCTTSPSVRNRGWNGNRIRQKSGRTSSICKPRTVKNGSASRSRKITALSSDILHLSLFLLFSCVFSFGLQLLAFRLFLFFFPDVPSLQPFFILHSSFFIFFALPARHFE